MRAGPTSAKELDAWAEKHVPGFAGVYARDQLPELSTPGASYVINLDPSYSQNGTHWTCARVLRDAPNVVFFDPFGIRPPPDVTARAWRVGRGALFSDVAQQRLDEKNCGPRCLAVLERLAHAPNDAVAFAQICDE